MKRLCGFLLAMTCFVQASPSQAQQITRHEVRIRVSDMEKSVGWYSAILGFEERKRVRDANGGALAYLSRGDALLVLRHDPEFREAGPSAVIKVGLLLPDFSDLADRFERESPESILVPDGSLPAATDLDGWPTRYFLARDPDGTLVQGFGQAGEIAAASWFLAAVSVDELEAALPWFLEAAGFEEVARPDRGDPRVLLRRDTFYLEVGEFGPPPNSRTPSVGVRQLRLHCRRPGRQWLEAPEGFRINRCGIH